MTGMDKQFMHASTLWQEKERESGCQYAAQVALHAIPSQRKFYVFRRISLSQTKWIEDVPKEERNRAQ